MAVRMKDIAAELGVSVMTVSKVLRNQGRIGTATRERILRRIKELGYQPNLNARALSSGRSYLVGLVVPDLMHPFFAAMAKTISRKLRLKGYALAISSSEEDPGVEEHEISSFLAHRVDALVLASTQRSGKAGIFRKIRQAGVPFVLVDRVVPGLRAHFVGSDNHAIGIMATEHLLERGYRRIAHIYAPLISTGISRLEGYRAALKRHGHPMDAELVVPAESADERGEQCGFQSMHKLLALKDRPDAVFCYNDVIGYGAMKAILDAGLRVPDDVAVIGVSNLASLSFWEGSPIALTTVDQGVAQIGEWISDLVLELIDDRDDIRRRSVLLPSTVVARQST